MVVGSATVSDRRVTVSAGVLRGRPQTAELLVHALAQLPDRTSLSLPEDVPAPDQLRRLARAFGLDERLVFGGSRSDRSLDGLLGPRPSLGSIVETLTEDDDPPASLRPDNAL